MLSQNNINDIYDHAVQEYPFECCGIVTGDSRGINYVHKCRNIQNDLHKKDPDNYKRDARTAYYIDPRETMKILRDADKNGDKVAAFYHSHPDHDAYFSDTDRKLALMENEPIFPDTAYIIISVYNKKIKEALAYTWNLKKQHFDSKKIV